MLKKTTASPKVRPEDQLTSTSLIEKAIWHTALTQKTLAPASSEVIREGLKLETPYPDSARVLLSLTLNDGMYAQNLLANLKKYYEADASEINTAKLALAATNKRLNSLSKHRSKDQAEPTDSQSVDRSSSDQSEVLSTAEKETLKKQLAVYKVIRSYVQIPYTQFSIIPTTFDVESSSLEVMVKQLNDSQIDRQKLLQQKNSVALENINKTIRQLKSDALVKLDSMFAATNARLLGKVAYTAPRKGSGEVLKPKQGGNSKLHAELFREKKALEGKIRSYNDVANSPVSVVESARPLWFIILLALISGVILAVGIMYSVKIFGKISFKEIQKRSKMPVLGMVGNYQHTELPVAYTGKFGLQLNAILESLKKVSKSNVLIFTSMLPGEGKSFISANLALMMAGSGKSVLLIRYQNDRKSTTATGAPLIRKLSAYATTDDAAYHDIRYKTTVDGLWVIDLAGVDPLKYLNNTWMNSLIDHASVNYDLVLIDSNFIPPAKLSLATDKTPLNFVNILSTKLKSRENINILNTLFIARNQTNLYLVVNDFH